MPDYPPPVPYQRVLPRDLFNESNLLKCWGRLQLLILGGHPIMTIEHIKPELGFQIYQNQLDGSIEVINLKLIINGKVYRVFRPLNSREPYPLYVQIDEENTDIPIFTDEGDFDDEFDKFLDKQSVE